MKLARHLVVGVLLVIPHLAACADDATPPPEKQRSTSSHVERDPGLVGPDEVEALKEYYRETETELAPYQDGEPGVFYESVNDEAPASAPDGNGRGDDDDDNGE
jgi:hypothetical protein